MVDLKCRVRRYIREYSLIRPKDHIIVGLSGGADSVCLLCILKELSEEMDLTLEAVHVHHGIRGREADRDAGFAQELCRQLGVELYLHRADVPALAETWKLSLEEAGRRVRYEIFRQRAESRTDVRIAVAHHMDDQAETVLMNLCRGTGIRGIGAMAPMSGRLIRPLLKVRRREIEEFLRQQGRTWCEDSTNRDTDYTRNRIRGEILPELTENVNMRTVEHLAAAAEQARELDEWLSELAGSWIREHVESGVAAVEVSSAELAACAGPLRRRILLELLSGLAGASRDIGSRHLTALESLVGEEKGGALDLPYGILAERIGSRLRLGVRTDMPVEGVLLPTVMQDGIVLPLKRFDSGSISIGSIRVSWQVISRGDEEIPQKEYTKWFDYDKMQGAVLIRSRRKDDVLALAGVGRKALRRYMIDAHIPAADRDRIPILAEENRVLWVIGGRMSAEYQVTPDTDRVLTVTVTLTEGEEKQ